MATGRKPKPISDHIRAGTYRVDRHDRPSPAADRTKPKPPAGLFREARSAWTELVRELDRLGTLDSRDVHLIELAAVCLGRLRQARAAIAKTGLEVKGDRGAVVAPALRAELAAIKELRGLLAEFGLSPTSRARLGIAAPEETAEEMFERTLGPHPRKVWAASVAAAS